MLKNCKFLLCKAQNCLLGGEHFSIHPSPSMPWLCQPSSNSNNVPDKQTLHWIKSLALVAVLFSFECHKDFPTSLILALDKSSKYLRLEMDGSHPAMSYRQKCPIQMGQQPTILPYSYHCDSTSFVMAPQHNTHVPPSLYLLLRRKLEGKYCVYFVSLLYCSQIKYCK